LARAFNYTLKRRASFTLHEDGCLCLSNSAAERGLRGSSWAEILAVLRIRSWRTSSCCLVPPDRHAKMNGVDPQAWLMDIIARIAAHSARRPTNYYPRIGSRIRDLRSSGKTTHVNKVHHQTKTLTGRLHPNLVWRREDFDRRCRSGVSPSADNAMPAGQSSRQLLANGRARGLECVAWRNCRRKAKAQQSGRGRSGRNGRFSRTMSKQ